MSAGVVINRATMERREGVNIRAFDPSEWLIEPDLSAVASVPDIYWKISGDAVVEMTGDEKIVADAAVLADMKIHVILSLKSECRDYIEAILPPASQRSLIALLDEARAIPYPNRKAYIQQALDWTKQAIGYCYGVGAVINAMETRAEVEAAAWDFAQFTASYPGTWIGGAIAIPD